MYWHEVRNYASCWIISKTATLAKMLTEIPYLYSLAYTEMYLALAAIVRRFDLALFDTDRARDVDSSRDCFTGEASVHIPGTRVTVREILA